MISSCDLLGHAYHALPDGARWRYALFEPSGKPHATVMIAPGRREFIEKKYDELGRRLLDRGYRLVLFEWRGQGLSSRFLDGPMRQRDHCVDFATHLEDLRSFYLNVVLQNHAGPLLVHGHSLGGHLLLRWLAEDRPVDVTAAFLSAPMLGLSALPVQGLAQAISWMQVKWGHLTDYAGIQHDYDARNRIFQGNPLTQDPERFAIIERYFAAHPDMVVGGVTWGWMLAALRSLHIAQEPDYLPRINIPVLSLIGGKDRVTPAIELQRYLRLIPQAETVVIPGARHDVMNESDLYRLDAWRHIESFLGKYSF
jgi:lysophospholipase